MARTKSNIPANETNADRFVRLVEPRVSNALDSLERIGKLANPATYEYDKADIASIFQVIREMVDKVEKQFNQPGTPKRNVFQLKKPTPTKATTTK